MKQLTLAFLCLSAVSVPLTAQVCDPSVAPTGLTSTITPGSGVLLEWDAVPASVGVQLRVDLPSGSPYTLRIIGFERDQVAVPEALLTPGTYTFRVQAACSTVPPFAVTPISASSSFTIGGVSSCPATVTDIDGNVYNTVQIGDQCWTQENLKVEHYGNGDAIPTGLSNSAWQSTINGAFAVYDNVASNKATYGLLYNWYAVNDSRSLCPTGWHVPSFDEWTDLTDFLGGNSVAGGKMKTTGTLGAGTGLWQAPNTAATNSSGFSGIPGGFRFSNGTYDVQGLFGYYWSSSSSAFNAFYQLLRSDTGSTGLFPNARQGGFSVRCLQD